MNMHIPERWPTCYQYISDLAACENDCTYGILGSLVIGFVAVMMAAFVIGAIMGLFQRPKMTRKQAIDAARIIAKEQQAGR